MLCEVLPKLLRAGVKVKQRFPIRRVQVREGTGTAALCLHEKGIRGWHLSLRWLCGQKLEEETSEDIRMVFCPGALEAGSGKGFCLPAFSCSW